MLEVLEPGDTIDVKGPCGEQFLYVSRGICLHYGSERHVTRINMVAGGTGITPMHQLLSAVLNDPLDCTQLRLMFANSTEEDILLRRELDAVAVANPKQLKLSYVVCEPSQDWKGHVGFVRKSLFEEFLFPAGKGTLTLLCGPPGMLTHACRPGLSQMGFVKGLTCIEL